MVPFTLPDLHLSLLSNRILQNWVAGVGCKGRSRCIASPRPAGSDSGGSTQMCEERSTRAPPSIPSAACNQPCPPSLPPSLPLLPCSISLLQNVHAGAGCGRMARSGQGWMGTICSNTSSTLDESCHCHCSREIFPFKLTRSGLVNSLFRMVMYLDPSGLGPLEDNK